jgi:hypothetical protein
MTGWAPTNTVASLGSYNASGNFAIMGFSSAAGQNGLSLFGFIGVTDPTDSVAAILLNAGKKSGTAQQALGTSETTFQLVNGGIGSQITVLGSGNVGIGVTTPSSLLHIFGAGSGNNVTYTKYTCGDGGDIRVGKKEGVSNDAIFGTWSNNDVLFYANSAERMRITLAGNVGIGETPTSSIGWARILTLNGNNVGDTAYILKKTGSAQEIAFGTDGSNLYVDVAGAATATAAAAGSIP